ncbi:MAG: glycosyltransferase [Gammaproteobacteria bacterium]|nr:glycosyltransferase [Gammaproteobacteria bacterium]
MTATAPAITIIMPCYNSAQTILGSIASVCAQTFTDWELLIIDDGSRDDSATIARKIEDPRIQVLVQSNQGSAGARNTGLAAARGSYIAFLDADDTWDPEFLHKMHATLAPRPDAVLAYCGWQNIGVTGGRGQPFVPPDYDPMDRFEVLLGGCRWPIHAVLSRREDLLRTQGFDVSFKTSEDYDLWMRVAPQGRLVLVPEVLAFYQHHGGAQITKNRLRVALNHHRAQQKFLEQNPQATRLLGRAKIRKLVTGELLRRAYACYWDRDLPAARALFRKVMRAGYGTVRDWTYMLPALLPLNLHVRLLKLRDTRTP